MKFMKLLSAALLVGVLALNAESDMFLSHAGEKNSMMVSDAWSRARPADAIIGGAFATLHNMEDEEDRLVAASSPVADRVEIHSSAMKDGVMSMFRIEELVIPAGETIMMKPGSFHVMLMGLKEPLTKGKEFPVTFNFAHAGEVTVTVHVKEAGAMDMKMHKHKQD